MIAAFCIWAITRIVNTRNETLAEGNRTLAQIQANIAVSTAHGAASVENLRTLALYMERLGGRIDTHDGNEETRHRSTSEKLDRIASELRETRDRARVARDVLDQRERDA